MSIITKYLFILTYLNFPNIFGIIVKGPASPCPDKFLYKFDSNWFGDILIGPMDYNLGYAMLQIKFIQNRRVPDEIVDQFKSYVKDSLVLMEEVDILIEKIKNGKPVNYRVYFPYDDLLPEVTAIILNGETICSGPDKPSYGSVYYVQKNVSWPILENAQNVPNIGIERSIKRNRPILSPNALPLKIEIPNFMSAPQRTQITNSKCGIINNQNYNPWLVGLFNQTNNQYNFICSGSLISSRHVITAAHCLLFTSKEIIIKLGSNDATTITGPDISIRYSRIIYTHPDYDRDSDLYYADLSIILLNEDVAITQKVRPICLWSKEMAHISVVGQSSQLVGWEINQNGFTNTNPAWANINVNSIDECYIFSPKYYHDISICTSDRTQGTNPCSRYSGGALIFTLNNRHTLKGIMTLTNSELNPHVCDPSNKYSIFTDISKYSDWINLYLRSS